MTRKLEPEDEEPGAQSEQESVHEAMHDFYAAHPQGWAGTAVEHLSELEQRSGIDLGATRLRPAPGIGSEAIPEYMKPQSQVLRYTPGAAPPPRPWHVCGYCGQDAWEYDSAQNKWICTTPACPSMQKQS